MANQAVMITIQIKIVKDGLLDEVQTRPAVHYLDDPNGQEVAVNHTAVADQNQAEVVIKAVVVILKHLALTPIRLRNHILLI